MSPRLRSNADEVSDLKSTFTDRGHVMRSIPFTMKGAFRCALRTALEEVISGIERHCEIRVIGVLEVVSVVAGTCPKEAVGGTNAEFGTSVCQETGAGGHSPCSHQS